MAATVKPSPQQQVRSTVSRLRPVQSLLLDVPGSEALARTLLEWHAARVAEAEARDALALVESETRIDWTVARSRADVQDRYSRADLDRVRDAAHALHVARTASDQAERAVATAEATLLKTPAAREFLAEVVAALAADYQRALDLFVATEETFDVAARQAALTIGDPLVKQAALAFNSGEHRRIPADNLRTLTRLAKALQQADETAAAS